MTTVLDSRLLLWQDHESKEVYNVDRCSDRILKESYYAHAARCFYFVPTQLWWNCCDQGEQKTMWILIIVLYCDGVV
jgi:hypothetical protein